MQNNKPHTYPQYDMLSATPPLPRIYLPPTVKRLAGNAAEGLKGLFGAEDPSREPS